jgi:hypothetical protein
MSGRLWGGKKFWRRVVDEAPGKENRGGKWRERLRGTAVFSSDKASLPVSPCLEVEAEQACSSHIMEGNTKAPGC